MKFQIIHKKETVYKIYKEKFDFRKKDELKDLKKHLAELREFSYYYKLLLNPETEDDPDINKELKYIKLIQVSVSYPFLMCVLKDYKNNVISKEILIEVLKTIQSYCFRRAIYGHNTGPLNK